MKRTLLAVLAAALLAGGVAAVALAGHGRSRSVNASLTAAPDRPGGLLQAAADYLGVSLATLTSDLANGQTLAQIANGTSGKSADGLIAALVAADRTRITNLVDNASPRLGHGFGPGFGFGHPVIGAGLQAAADYLGVSLATLRSDLANGQTLAQIANGTSGKSADGLIQALVTAAKAKLDAAVTAGKLTQAQEDAIATHLQQAITDLVNGTFPGHRFGGFLHAGFHF